MADSSVQSFLCISSLQDLAVFLGVPTKEVAFFAFARNDFYHTQEIIKSDGGRRKISAPVPKLKRIQKKIACALLDVYQRNAPAEVHGFVRQKGTVTNALKHVNKRAIVKIDLVDFFPSISSARIHGLFCGKLFGFSDETANALTNLVCYKGSLPQGAPTSPVLSNMICFPMDKALIAYARRNNLCYTRYAEDMVFASTSKRAMISLAPNREHVHSCQISEEVLSIIDKQGFTVNEKKSGYFGLGVRQVVTGVVVNKKANFKRSDYRYYRNLFHYWKMNDAQSAASRYIQYSRGKRYHSRFYSEDGQFLESSFIAHIYGVLSYFHMITRANYRSSRPMQLLWTSFYSLTGQTVPELLPEQLVFRLSTQACYRLPLLPGSTGAGIEEYEASGTTFLGGGKLVTCRHCLKEPSSGAIRAIYDSDLSTVSADLGVLVNPINVDIASVRENYLLDISAIDLPSVLAPFPSLRLNSSYLPQRGERVAAYGYADGHSHIRIVTAVVVEILEEDDILSVVVDRAFIKGMSGGPVFNSRGEVIGLVVKGSGNGSYDRDGHFILLSSVGRVDPELAKDLGI